MLIRPFQFEVGDVLSTGFGAAKLVSKEEDDSEGREIWIVRYVDLDIEMEHSFVDTEYIVLEVAE